MCDQVVLGLTSEGLDACFDTAAEGDAAITLKPLTLLFQNIVSLLEKGPPQHVWEDLRSAAAMAFRCDIACFSEPFFNPTCMAVT